MPDLALIRTLLQRAMYDLEHGWSAAAYDAIRRALAVDFPQRMRGIVLAPLNYKADTPMARGKSTKLLTTLPDDYSADWLTKLDKRTKVARAVVARIKELESDAGGAESLSTVRRSLIRHAAWLDAIVESHELRLAAGQEVDTGAYTQSLNSLLGLYRLIGLERRARKTESLRDVMRGSEVPSA